MYDFPLPSSTEISYSLEQFHKQCIQLLSLKERNKEDEILFISLAHAYYANALQITPIAFNTRAQGYFFILTAYCMNKEKSLSLVYAEEVLKWMGKHKSMVQPLYAAYIYLALGRIYALAEKTNDSMQYFTWARQLVEQIPEQTIKNTFLHEFRTKL